MKKIVKTGLLALFVLTVFGCNSRIDINFGLLDVDLSDETSVKKEYTEEEIARFNKINSKYNFTGRFARAAETKDDKLVEEMIDALHEEFGENATDYYQTVVVYKEIEPIKVENRSLKVGIKGEGSGLYNAYLISEVTKDSGIWWCQLKYDCYVMLYNKYTGKEEGLLILNSSSGTYSDSETDKYKRQWDWDYLRKRPDSFHQGSWLEDDGFFEDLENEVLMTHRNTVHMEGNNAYGWYPDVTKLSCSGRLKSDLLSSGTVINSIYKTNP